MGKKSSITLVHGFASRYIRGKWRHLLEGNYQYRKMVRHWWDTKWYKDPLCLHLVINFLINSKKVKCKIYQIEI